MSHAYTGPSFGLPTLTPAIKRLLLLNAAVFVLNAVLGGRLTDWFAVSWSGLGDGYGLGTLRVVSYQFTHSFRDPMHLLWNLLVLYFFGTMAESALGYRGTFRLYLTAGAVGGLLQILLGRLQGMADMSVVGASGSCYAFLVYAACLAPRSLVIVLFFPIQLWVLAAFLVGIGVYSAYVELVVGSGSGVAHSAHIGGAAWGYVVHRFRWRWFHDLVPFVHQQGFWAGLRQRWQRARAARTARSAEQDQQRLDELLDKVHRQGIGSLSDAERRFLTKASDRARRR